MKTENSSSSPKQKGTSSDSQSKKVKPYLKTITVLQQVERVIPLRKKKEIFIYSWKKLQKEVLDYWMDKNTKIPEHKLALCEDQRLCLMAYALVQS
jgi:hypothetical protein